VLLLVRLAALPYFGRGTRAARDAVEGRTCPQSGRLSRGQHAKLTAIGIGHGHAAGLALADVDASCPEGDQTVDLLVLIAVNGWSEVEM
jgi:hypothetical protein